VEKFYFGALEEIMAQAQERAQMTLDALASHAFSQV
jgi:hypothetical protein